MTDYTLEERAAIIRAHLASKGFAMHQEWITGKYDQIRDQFMLSPKERHTDYTDWSVDKLSGMAIGLGWARNAMSVWLAQYEAAQKSAQVDVPEEGHGNPYADDTATSAAN